MAVARRAYLYIMAFAGLVTSLYATAGMLALIVTTVTQHSSALLGASDARSRASLYLAELVVGVPVWLIHWLIVERRAERSPRAQLAPERRLFAVGVFAVTSVVALVALRQLLRELLVLPAPATSSPSAGITAGARLLIFGAGWLAFVRAERASTVEASAAGPAAPPAAGLPAPAAKSYDPAVYMLAGVALGFLVAGAYQAIGQIVRQVLAIAPAPLLLAPEGSPWATWGSIASWLFAGGAVWGAAWQYIGARRRPLPLHLPYLDLVLLLAVPATIDAGVDLLYELLRRLFGYQPTPNGWNFLQSALPALLVAGAAWAYHWAALRRLPVPTAASTAEADRTGMPTPRRAPLAWMTLLGLAVAAPALVSLLWLLLDHWLNTGSSLSGGAWWRDRMSFGLAAGMLGGALWLEPWSLLQRAAAIAPDAERAAPARRHLLAAVVVISALFAVGFLIALLWLAFRSLLGETLGASGLSLALKELSAVVVAAALAAYHGFILRDDLRSGAAAPGHLRTVALVAPDAEAALDALRQRSGLTIELRGRLLDDGAEAQLSLAELGDALASLSGDGRTEQALLILRRDGGTLHRYRV